MPIRKREHKFIEEQIFNWTYADEQRGKEEFAVKHPGKWNPYGSLPQMRLLTYQMPDELLAIASAGEFDEFDLNEFFAATGTGKSAQFKHKSDVPATPPEWPSTTIEPTFFQPIRTPSTSTFGDSMRDSG